MIKQALEEKLGIPLTTFQTPNWAKFRGEHHPQSCICDEKGNVIGLILKNLDHTFITIPALLHLKYACISDNPNLTNIVFEQALPTLKYLDLSDNQLTHIFIPKGFKQLDRLDLSRNQLKKVDFEGELPVLNMLDLSGNKIKNWNVWELSKLPKLVYFYFSRNPLNESLTAYHNGGANYLEGLKTLNKAFGDGDGVFNKEYKLLVVGDGKAGKTAFVNRLVHNRFIEPKGKDWDSTHAISVKQFTNEEGLYKFDYLLNVWDFGGQDIYHTTHRLFMQSNSTYILVWNRETEIDKEFIEREEGGEIRKWKNRKWKYWLRYIAYLGKNSPVVMAQSYSSKRNPRPPHPNKKIIEQGYQNQFEELIFTHMDSKPDGLEDNNYLQLVESLNRAIDGLQRLEYLPEHWVKIRKTLEERRNKVTNETDKTGNNVMSYADYHDLAEGFGEDNPEKLLKDWLVKTGVVFYKEGLFDNKIILNQEWAIKAIYTLFDRDDGFFHEIDGKKGKFSGKDLRRYWKKYSLEEQQLFLSFMTSCQMCFEVKEKEEEGKGYREKPFAERQFMAIELLSKDRPAAFQDVEEDWEKDQKVLAYLQYRHSFLHFGIIQSFIARTFHFANVRQVYKNGILLRIDGVPVIIEAMYNEEEHNGAITIKLPKISSTILHRIRKEFSNIHERKDIPALVSLDGQVFVDLKKLGDKQNEQQTEAVCGTTINIADFKCFLEKEEQVESLSEEVQRMEDKAKREESNLLPKTNLKIYFSYAWGDDHEVAESREEIVNQLYDSLTNEGFDVRRDKMNLKYGGLISKFMGEIGGGGLIVIFVSKKYVESDYCMFELYEIARNNKWDKELFTNKILPIPIELIAFDDPDILDRYFDFWEQKEKKWENLIKKRAKQIRPAQTDRYHKIKNINQNFGDLSDWLSDINAMTLKLLKEDDFELVKQAIKDRLKNFS